jgi:hypothetical protein
MLGEAVLVAGVVMWLAGLPTLDYSPRDVALALIAIGLPALIAGPLGAVLTRVEHPAGLFKLVGWLRVALAVALIGMHFLTILSVLDLLLFGISMCGRLRSSLRIAAMRACLAPGEPEQVAASTHFAAVVVAVVSPLLASLLYILDGERILLVAIGAALIFLLGTSADAMVEALPPARRAFLLARPEPETDDGAPEALEDEDAEPGEVLSAKRTAVDPTALMEQREAALPEWQQWGPGTVIEALADIRAGLSLIGGRSASAAALRVLSSLALVGGGMAVFEVFYITDHLYQPTFYLGALLAAEGAGLAVGATLWSDLGRRGSGRVAMLVGTLATGIALIALARAQQVGIALLIAAGLGAANALAVEGAREALRSGLDGVERRAVAAAESMVAALCGMLGAGVFVLFHRGYAIVQHGAGGAAKRIVLLDSYPPAEIILLAGVGLVLVGVITIGTLYFGGLLMDKVRERRAMGAGKRRRGAPAGPLDELPDEGDDEGDSRTYAAARGRWEDDDGWDGEDWEGQDWDGEPDDQDARDEPEYGDSQYGPSYAADEGWDDESDDEDWDPPQRGGRAGPRMPPGRGGRRR